MQFIAFALQSSDGLELLDVVPIPRAILASRAPEPQLDARLRTRLLGARAQSSPRVAARSPRETVESVVERTNTPRAGAVMVSTSSP